ncbi:MAG TPA: DUF1521 domain-containing protein [Pyrinomonadaceae bacterium]|jgi:hypothetical protein|nr:DUF1521 domain-containing protein [Pyrinomonadaceae bacterium]
MSNVSLFSNQSININFNFNGLAGLGANSELLALLEATNDLADALGNFNDKFAALAEKFGATSALCQCAPVAPPALEDSCHPAGSLRAEGDVITTPGGYKIEMLGQYEWKITGPDGKETRIWGDPHVDEGDGGKWDFKRDSTFVLGDGTRINVSTVPYGDMTVTGSLEIISGNDRVLVSDIDKGKGKIGTVTQDGYQHANSFGDNDVFVMGREADDWSFKGNEITGSENGGESFKTGGELHPLTEQVSRFGNARNWANSIFDSLLDSWRGDMRPNDFGYNAYCDNDNSGRVENDERYDRRQHAEALRDAFRALADMFDALSRWLTLSDQLTTGRNRSVAV